MFDPLVITHSEINPSTAHKRVVYGAKQTDCSIFVFFSSVTYIVSDKVLVNMNHLQN